MILFQELPFKKSMKNFGIKTKKKIYKDCNDLMLNLFFIRKDEDIRIQII